MTDRTEKNHRVLLFRGFNLMTVIKSGQNDEYLKNLSYIDEVIWRSGKQINLHQQVQQLWKLTKMITHSKLLFSRANSNKSPLTRLLRHIIHHLSCKPYRVEKDRDVSMTIMSDLNTSLPYLSRKPTVHLKTPPKATSSPNITEK